MDVRRFLPMPFKDCSHGAIAIAFFIVTYRLYGIQCKCSYGAISIHVATLNPIKPYKLGEINRNRNC